MNSSYGSSDLASKIHALLTEAYFGPCQTTKIAKTLLKAPLIDTNFVILKSPYNGLQQHYLEILEKNNDK